MMRYPILIEEGSEHCAFGVAVPDLPGCFPAGDTLDEAMEAAKEAAAAWIDAALDAGTAQARGLPGYEGWSIGIIEIDPALFDDSIERVNITLPKRVLRRLDDLATARHMSRGAFISELTMRAHSNLN
jgi:predicted RNase H-like HicB family nuclease